MATFHSAGKSTNAPHPSASHQRSFPSRLNLSKVFQPRALLIGAKSLAARFKTQKVRGLLTAKPSRRTLEGNIPANNVYDLWVHLYKQRKRRRLGATN